MPVASMGYRRLALATVTATFLLIVVGCIVRVSDSGLGCGPGGAGLQGWPLGPGGAVRRDRRRRLHGGLREGRARRVGQDAPPGRGALPGRPLRLRPPVPGLQGRLPAVRPAAREHPPDPPRLRLPDDGPRRCAGGRRPAPAPVAVDDEGGQGRDRPAVPADRPRRPERLADERVRRAGRRPPDLGDAPVGDADDDDDPARARARPRARARAAAAARRGGDRLMEAGTATARAAARGRLRALAADYFDMTKPRVQTLLLFTTITTMYVAGKPSLGLVALTCLGGALSAGGAGAINHWFDRDLDAVMTRTANRPLPAGRVAPRNALVFGILLGASAFALLSQTVNLLAAALSLCGLLGYVFVYTIWRKRRTPQNIVIGGAAGAVPPLVAWAATTGRLSGSALYLFAIVFYWTPPHFWALSLL